MIICIFLYLVNTTIFSLMCVYYTTCFGPLCEPSSGVSGGLVVQLYGGGGEVVGGGARSRYVGFLFM